MASVLIVDDEQELSNFLAVALKEQGHTLQCLSCGKSVLKAVREYRFDLILLDLMLGDMSGMDVLRQLRSTVPDIPVIMMTAFGNVQFAVNTMKLGAVDFISKPFEKQELICSIDTILSMKCCTRPEPPLAIIGESPLFRKVMELALKFAVPNVNVLILGDTGTGKELFARAIHLASKRIMGPFVAVDCSTLDQNLFESELFGHEKGAFTGAIETQIGRLEVAQGGTLFLDEIANLPVALQAKLLRVLQERCMQRVGGRETIRLDLRVISATNVEIKDSIRTGKFRRDLYYRLNEIAIRLPPLCERKEDIRLLAEYFATQYAIRFNKPVPIISDTALKIMEQYAWPGNVRELENAIKAAVVMSDGVIPPQHLPPELGAKQTTGSVQTMSSSKENNNLHIEIDVGLSASEVDLKAVGAEAAKQAEKTLLSTLVKRRISRAQMAKMLHVDPKTLRVKLRKLNLEN